MIAVLIIGVLIAIAWPAYSRYIARTNRAAAAACLSENANYMERYYTTNLSYTGATLPGLDCTQDAQTGKNYGYSLTSTSSTYTITAAPKNLQKTRDTTCGSLTINEAGTRNVIGTGTVPQCW